VSDWHLAAPSLVDSRRVYTRIEASSQGARITRRDSQDLLQSVVEGREGANPHRRREHTSNRRATKIFQASVRSTMRLHCRHSVWDSDAGALSERLYLGSIGERHEGRSIPERARPWCQGGEFDCGSHSCAA
jgi:hypothetical protein